MLHEEINVQIEKAGSSLISDIGHDTTLPLITSEQALQIPSNTMVLPAEETWF